MRERERLIGDREAMFQRRTCWDWVLLQERDSMREKREIQWAHREIEHREGWEASWNHQGKDLPSIFFN